MNRYGWILFFVIVFTFDAGAQAVARSAPPVNVPAELVGEDITLQSLIATATSGTAYGCNAVLASCVDLGPGANAYIGTNLSDEILLGPAASGGTNMRNGTTHYWASGLYRNTNGVVDCYFGCSLQNTASNMPVLVDEQDGFRIKPYVALKTCGDGTSNTVREGTMILIAGSGGSRTAFCLCTYDGTSAYAWQHFPSGTVGTTTTCAP